LNYQEPSKTGVSSQGTKKGGQERNVANSSTYGGRTGSRQKKEQKEKKGKSSKIVGKKKNSLKASQQSQNTRKARGPNNLALSEKAESKRRNKG